MESEVIFLYPSLLLLSPMLPLLRAPLFSDGGRGRRGGVGRRRRYLGRHSDSVVDGPVQRLPCKVQNDTKSDLSFKVHFSTPVLKLEIGGFCFDTLPR